MTEHIGELIRKLRKENKDTLESLSKKLSYDLSNLSKVERGLYGASLDLLKKISQVYSIDPSVFFGEHFTKAESKLMLEDTLAISELKQKYDFQDATDEEIEEAIKYIHFLRTQKRINQKI